jgi:hypothetical protein
MGTPAVSQPPSTLGTPAGELPLAVWPCAQTSAQYQRAGRYLPASTAHPAKMLPELARRIIAEYSPPGGLVVDPMCGIGTTLVEAAALGRRAVGVELEPRWAELARANLGFALSDEQAKHGEVRLGDARLLPQVLADLAGTVDLVATSPPYGGDVGMIDKPAWLAGRSLCRRDTSTTPPTTPTSDTLVATATWPSWPVSTPAALRCCGPAAAGGRHQEPPPPGPGTASGHHHG